MKVVTTIKINNYLYSNISKEQVTGKYFRKRKVNESIYSISIYLYIFNSIFSQKFLIRGLPDLQSPYSNPREVETKLDKSQKILGTKKRILLRKVTLVNMDIVFIIGLGLGLYVKILFIYLLHSHSTMFTFFFSYSYFSFFSLFSDFFFGEGFISILAIPWLDIYFNSSYNIISCCRMYFLVL